MFKGCMFKLSQLAKFLHDRRRKKLFSKFGTKVQHLHCECQHLHCEPISPNSPRRAQVTGRFKRQIFAGLSYSRKYRIDLCSHIKPVTYLIVGCMALG